MDSSNKIIQCSCIGKCGRFGNQLFQYAFARAYAEKYNCTLEIPTWIGEKIFKNVSHPPISKRLPRTACDKVPWGQTNIDLFGYFQQRCHLAILSKSKLQEWFTFQDKWFEYFINLKSVAVAHLRRGDYVTKHSKIFCIVSKESYQKAFEKFNIRERDVVWKTEENQVRWRDMEDDLLFLPDFFEMMLAQHLFRANSTFSFWAGFFNRNKVYNPVIGNKMGLSDVEFVEGNGLAIKAGNDPLIIKDNSQKEL
ncbi:MAG: alpha-1,2-fucosyltransferase [Actinobacteria bacterium]|nr:alpha-1,2-fucosyltransferase [Actinomycetota bacterium]